MSLPRNTMRGARTGAVATEQLIIDAPCRLHAILPEQTTAGTITVRDAIATGGSNVKMVCAIGMTQQGKEFHGAVFEAGLTLQQSSAGDRCLVIFELL